METGTKTNNPDIISAKDESDESWDEFFLRGCEEIKKERSKAESSLPAIEHQSSDC
jgi:hypothetical protein